MSLNPPATLSPGTGGAPEGEDLRVLDLLGPLRPQAGHDRLVAQLRGSSASSNGSSMMNIEPKFEPLACCTKE